MTITIRDTKFRKPFFRSKKKKKKNAKFCPEKFNVPYTS